LAGAPREGESTGLFIFIPSFKTEIFNEEQRQKTRVYDHCPHGSEFKTSRRLFFKMAG